MALGAITLDAAGCAGKSGAGVTLKSLINGQSEIAVVACRDLSRQVVGHGSMITGFVPRLAGYPHDAAGKAEPRRARTAYANTSSMAYSVSTRNVLSGSAGSGEMPAPSFLRYSIRHSNEKPAKINVPQSCSLSE